MVVFLPSVLVLQVVDRPATPATDGDRKRGA
jgi:hypothetical protein